MKVLLLCVNSGFAVNVMRSLADLKAECHVFGQGRMPEVAMSRYCHRFTSCDLSQKDPVPPGFVDMVNRYCSKNGIAVVIPVDYSSGYRLSRVKHDLLPEIKIFPVAQTEVLRTLDDKWTFAQFLEKNGLPGPKTFLAEDPAQLAQVDLPFPRIVKSVHGTGGNVESYIKRDLTAYLASGTSADPSDRFPFIVQEFIPGSDIDLSILAYRGKVVAWTVQKWESPKVLQFVRDEKVLELGRKVVGLLNFEGVAHFDMRRDERDGSVKFIECNPRFWRSLRASIWNGVNFVELGIRLARGEDVPEVNTSKDIVYVQPGKIMGSLCRGKLSVLKGIPDSTRKDLKQIFLDPVPLIVSTYHTLFEGDDLPEMGEENAARKPMKVLLGIWSMLAALLAGSAAASLLLHVPIERFMRDPVAQVLGGPFLGVMSNMGILMGSSMVAISFFMWFNLKGYKVWKEWAGFFLSAAVISGLLMVGDMFMFHEHSFSVLLSFQEKFLYLLYVVLLMRLLIRYHLVILRTRYWLLILSIGLFGTSWLIGRIPGTLEWQPFFEDAFKLFGIATWLGYFFDAGVKVMNVRKK